MRLLFLAVLLALTIPAAMAYEYDGDTVFINTTQAYISATPHTINGPGYVTVEWESKITSLNVTVLFGYNKTYLRPLQLDRWNPHNETVERSFTCSGFFNYTVNPNVFYCYNEGVLVYSHSFTSGNPGTKTAYWTETVQENWTQVQTSYTRISYNYDGKTDWYYIQNVPLQQGVRYKARVKIDAPYLTFGRTQSQQYPDYNGKYDIAFVPSSYGTNFLQAIEDGNFYMLDPTVSLTYYTYNQTHSMSFNVPRIVSWVYEPNVPGEKLWNVTIVNDGFNQVCFLYNVTGLAGTACPAVSAHIVNVTSSSGICQFQGADLPYGGNYSIGYGFNDEASSNHNSSYAPSGMAWPITIPYGKFWFGKQFIAGGTPTTDCYTFSGGDGYILHSIQIGNGSLASPTLNTVTTSRLSEALIKVEQNTTTDSTTWIHNITYVVYKAGTAYTSGTVSGNYTSNLVYNFLNYTVNATGEYTIQVQTEDYLGQLSSAMNSSPLNMTIKPFVSVTSIATPWYDDRNATFNATVSDPNNSTLASVLMRLYINGTNTFNLTTLSVANATTIQYQILPGNFTMGANISANIVVDDGLETNTTGNANATPTQSPPRINSWSVSPSSVVVSSESATFTLNCTSTQLTLTATAQVTDPNAVTTNYSMTLGSGLYTKSLTPSVTGVHQVIAYCNDTSGNITVSDQANFTATAASQGGDSGGGGGGGGGSSLTIIGGDYDLESPIVDQGFLFMWSFTEDPVEFNVDVKSSKPTQSCTGDGQFTCKVLDDGAGIRITYTETSHDFFTKVLRGQITTTSTTSELAETQVTFRIVNFGYSIGPETNKAAPVFLETFPYIIRVENGHIAGVRLVAILFILLVIAGVVLIAKGDT